MLTIILEPDLVYGVSRVIFREWLPQYKNYTLLYSLKQHGISNKTFHDKCDNQGPTLTIIVLQNGSIFGGYASKSWNNESGYLQAPGSFVFSITDGKKRAPMQCKMKQGKDQNAMRCLNNYGPTFGGGKSFLSFLFLSFLFFPFLPSPNSSFTNRHLNRLRYLCESGFACRQLFQSRKHL